MTLTCGFHLILIVVNSSDSDCFQNNNKRERLFTYLDFPLRSKIYTILTHLAPY